MKLKYRTWVVYGPQDSIADRNSRFPFDMLRRDPAYIHQDALKALLKHAEEGGNRQEVTGLPDNYTLVYTKLPGYLSTVMNPTVDRWLSFGWGKILPQEPYNIMNNPEEWVTVVGFDREVNPITVSLADWIAAKTMNEWHDKVYRLKQERGAI